MKHPTYTMLIPAPAECLPQAGQLPLSQLTRLDADPMFAALVPEVSARARHLGLNLSGGSGAALALRCDRTLAAEAWNAAVTPEGIVLTAGTVGAMRYALAALTQMLFAARITGSRSDALDCVILRDRPRFPWRGMHLDSARHFQDKETVKRCIRMLAEFRINSFHWHLTDSEGWRYASALVPAGARGTESDGQYTPDDLREVADFAAALGVRIVPEVDVPGHSAMLLKLCPQYACDPAHPGNELCLGNPETLPFLRRVFDELLEIFPDSPIIHLGGDEAETVNWERCPRCRQAMRDRGANSMRELENAFMADLTRFIVERGRRPMLWGTCSGQVYPPETIIQVWLDIREPLRVAPHGNKIVYSVHNSLYFDYPADLHEPWETWMFELSERGVYMTDPHIIWADAVRDAVLGTEGCLWTETVPQWRVVRKILPRLWAYSECAWSAPEVKDCDDLIRRRKTLEAAGYAEFLLSL